MATNDTTTSVTREVAALGRMTVPQLRSRYAEVYGETTNANNRAWLLKRVAWRIQTLAEGGLSERARQQAAELANDADLRSTPPRQAAVAAPTVAVPAAFRPDPRLPPAGTIITRPYRGQVIQVQVLADGFAYGGQTYPSLSAVARAVTGTHCNGFHFFKLGAKGGAA